MGSEINVESVEVGAEVIVAGPDAGCIRNIFAPGAISRDEGLDDALQQHLLDFVCATNDVGMPGPDGGE